MLSAADRELIAAAVDGEMTAAERRIAKQLLRKSEEARKLFAQLKRQAASLRQLPTVSSPFDFSCDILGLIKEHGIQPTPLPPESRRQRSAFWNPPLWAFMATAATLLMTVTLGSYYFFAITPSISSVKSSRPVQPEPRSDAAPTVAKADAHRDPVGPPVTLEEPVEQIASAPRLIEVSPTSPALPRDTELAGPVSVLPSELFDIAKVRMSLILALRDLDQAYPKQKLKDELGKDEMVRIDLFCKDLPRAYEMLQSHLRIDGHELFIDALLAERLKAKQTPELLFYTQGMTPEEVGTFLERLGADDKRNEMKKSGTGVFDNFVLAPSLKTDFEKLAKLLGIPLQNLKADLPKAGPIDLTKPLSDKTASQLAQNLTRPTGKTEKTSLILGYSPPNPTPQASREIKSFLDRRGEKKSGTKPLMLVLRLVG